MRASNNWNTMKIRKNDFFFHFQIEIEIIPKEIITQIGNCDWMQRNKGAICWVARVCLWIRRVAEERNDNCVFLHLSLID